MRWYFPLSHILIPFPMKPLFWSYWAALVLAAFLAWLPAKTLRAQAPAWQAAIASTTRAIAVANAADDNGNVYVVGYFDGMLTLGNSTLVSAGMFDVFIAKWNSAQNAFVWAQRAGGTDIDFARDVTVRGNEVYVVGNLGSQGGDFGAAQLSTAGLSDVFVAKLMDNGPSSQFNWATRAGGPGHDSVWGMAVSGSAVYLAGEFDGVGSSFGPTTLASVGQSDAFVAKVLDAGNSGSFVWARQAGGSGNDAAMDVAANGASVYVRRAPSLLPLSPWKKRGAMPQSTSLPVRFLKYGPSAGRFKNGWPPVLPHFESGGVLLLPLRERDRSTPTRSLVP